MSTINVNDRTTMLSELRANIIAAAAVLATVTVGAFIAVTVLAWISGP